MLIIMLAVMASAPGVRLRAEDQAACKPEDRVCILRLLQDEAVRIENPAWRDQTYRELAKTLAFEGRADEAVSLIDKIQNPDTQAMTIRGIGMAVADHKTPLADKEPVFAALREKASTITHPPSFAIALTYIAMARAFAGDDAGAWATAAEMENDALRHKAYGETAEIQAESGKFEAAMKSIAFIESASYRNKSYETVARILADRKMFAEALACAMKNENPFKKAESLQYILDQQKPREIPHQ